MDRYVELKRTPFPRNPESSPLGRNVLLRSASRITASRAGNSPAAESGKSAGAGKPLASVSDKRRAENRERRAMADRRWPDRRDGTVMCRVPDCGRPADDLHEILTRARCGSITDEDNTVPVCRKHNDELTGEPEWGYRLHLLRHSWAADRPLLAADSPVRRVVLARDGSRCTGCGCRVIDVPFALWCRAEDPSAWPDSPVPWLTMCGICADLDEGELEYRGYRLREGDEPDRTGVMVFGEGRSGATCYPWDDGRWHAGPAWSEVA